MELLLLGLSLVLVGVLVMLAVYLKDELSNMIDLLEKGTTFLITLVTLPKTPEQNFNIIVDFVMLIFGTIIIILVKIPQNAPFITGIVAFLTIISCMLLVFIPFKGNKNDDQEKETE